MKNPAKMVVVGRLGSPHGLQGWVKLFSFTEPSDNILHYPQWFIEGKSGWQPFAVTATQTGDGKHIRIKPEGCDSPEQAKLYTNALIAVSRDQLPAPTGNDYYWSDLEGLAVINTAGIALGHVDHLFETGANDVMVVKGDRERLLPFIKDVIIEVDLAAGKIVVDWEEDF